MGVLWFRDRGQKMSTTIRANEGEIIGEHLPSVQIDEERGGRLARGLALQLARIALVLAILGAWQLVAGRLIAEFWISSPTRIADRLLQWIQSGYLLQHIGITLEEMLWGFLLGSTAGIVSGFLLGSNPFFGKLLDPLITALYSLPKIALAPLFVLWLGIGIPMKVVLAATIVFFLVFWNTYAGVIDVDRELVDVLRVMGAKKRHILGKVILPGAISWIYVGLKLSIPYALIGAVVGELIASNKGIGFVLASSAGQFDTAGLFAALFVLMMISTFLNEVLNRTEGRLLRWKHAGREGAGNA
jgi:NitT/TauT family transport system permease protein